MDIIIIYITVIYIEIMEYKIKHLDKLLKLGIPKDKFTLIQSALFPVMNIRQNGDLDFILESSLVPIYKERILKIKGLNIKINNDNYKQFGCTGDDDLIKNHSMEINGLRFCHFKFYNRILRNRSYKVRKEKKRKYGFCDYEKIKYFFETKKHLQYPFTNIPISTWGNFAVLM
jgi:hypothetical protein|tara:strand:- start:1240 stop:1758 length:519 start_codon:yes stop_codon:yes gene_type:complete